MHRSSCTIFCFVSPGISFSTSELTKQRTCLSVAMVICCNLLALFALTRFCLCNLTFSSLRHVNHLVWTWWVYVILLQGHRSLVLTVCKRILELSLTISVKEISIRYTPLNGWNVDYQHHHRQSFLCFIIGTSIPATIGSLFFPVSFSYATSRFYICFPSSANILTIETFPLAYFSLLLIQSP